MAYFDKYGVEFSDDHRTLVRCPKDFKGTYIIPNSVQRIGEKAFNGCNGIVTIIIPDSVNDIGNAAFYYCSSLISIAIGNNVDKISHYL